MNKNSWIMFGMVAIVIISVVLVALLILVPQSEPFSEGNIDEYETITKTDYSYTESKDISEEAMKETYSITTEDVKEGVVSKQYKQGNTDPFAAQTTSQNTTNSGNTNTTNNNTNNTTNNTNNNAGSTNTTNNNSQNNAYSAEDK